MKTRNSKAKAFAFLGAAFVLLIALIFTGCPNNAGGGGSGGGNIDGVWKALSSTVNGGTPVPYPISVKHLHLHILGKRKITWPPS